MKPSGIDWGGFEALDQSIQQEKNKSNHQVFGIVEDLNINIANDDIPESETLLCNIETRNEILANLMKYILFIQNIFSFF